MWQPFLSVLPFFRANDTSIGDDQHSRTLDFLNESDYAKFKLYMTHKAVGWFVAGDAPT